MTNAVDINDVLDGHLSLEIGCVDRLLRNAFVPNLELSGRVVTLLTEYLGFPIPSPVRLEKISNRFRREVKAFAAEHESPVLALNKPDRTRWDDCELPHGRPQAGLAATATAILRLGDGGLSEPGIRIIIEHVVRQSESKMSSLE